MCRLLGEYAFFWRMESGYNPDLALTIELINAFPVNDDASVARRMELGFFNPAFSGPVIDCVNGDACILRCILA